MFALIERDFVSQLLRYVGVGLISGSIVHAGTLGGSTTRYGTLVFAGVCAFAYGTLLEHEHRKNLSVYILCSVLISIGIGMISGGIQHFVDGPGFASLLIPSGLCMAYIMYLAREHARIDMAKVVVIVLTSFVIYGTLQVVVQNMSPDMLEHHHDHDE